MSNVQFALDMFVTYFVLGLLALITFALAHIVELWDRHQEKKRVRGIIEQHEAWMAARSAPDRGSEASKGS